MVTKPLHGCLDQKMGGPPPQNTCHGLPNGFKDDDIRLSACLLPKTTHCSHRAGAICFFTHRLIAASRHPPHITTMSEPTHTPDTKQSNPAAGDTPTVETHSFQVEMQRLLQIMVHSLYSEREVFLRELLSNAADALSRLEFLQHTRHDLRPSDQPLEITLTLDAKENMLEISDNGIGMSREEMRKNLGSVAHSGSLAFLQRLAETKDQKTKTELIGQFGVGFYAAFMAAKRVSVHSVPADANEEGACWASNGEGNYTLEATTRKGRGTTIRLELKEDCSEFTTAVRIENIVTRYSNFIPYPIRLEGKRLNRQDAIWTKQPSRVSAEEHTDFHRFLTLSNDPPLHTIHIHIDAPVQYRALLYIPPNLGHDVLYNPKGYGLNLYSNRVLIQTECQHLLPMHLRFMRGVVDSEDLSLNVSREMVQNDPLLEKLRNSLGGRVLRELGVLAEKNAPKYGQFWERYGAVLKEGLATDSQNRERLLDLLRFRSTHTHTANPKPPPTDAQQTGNHFEGDSKDLQTLTSLKSYVERMVPDQKSIYYLHGRSRQNVEHSPLLEHFKAQKREVLFLYDEVDRFTMAQLTKYDEKPIVSIEQSSDEIGTSSVEGALEGETLETLLTFFRTTLGDKVGDVKASKRTLTGPALLIHNDKSGVAPHLEQMLKQIDPNHQAAPRILELNTAHPLLKQMSRLLQSHGEDLILTQLAEQILENHWILEDRLPKPEETVNRIQDLMLAAIAVQKNT